MHETLGQEVRSRRAAQAALGKRDREVERLQGKVAAYEVRRDGRRRTVGKAERQTVYRRRGDIFFC